MKHPDGSVICNKCRTDMVVVDAAYVCDCNVRFFANEGASDESNRLRQAIALLRGNPAICDRCHREDAYRMVRCYTGCEHAQCGGCANETRDDAIAEGAYGRRPQLQGDEL
jgi:hypothetical protein